MIDYKIAFTHRCLLLYVRLYIGLYRVGHRDTNFAENFQLSNDRGRTCRLESNLDIDERLILLNYGEATVDNAPKPKRGSRGAARAAKSLRWSV